MGRACYIHSSPDTAFGSRRRQRVPISILSKDGRRLKLCSPITDVHYWYSACHLTCLLAGKSQRAVLVFAEPEGATAALQVRYGQPKNVMHMRRMPTAASASAAMACVASPLYLAPGVCSFLGTLRSVPNAAALSLCRRRPPPRTLSPISIAGRWDGRRQTAATSWGRTAALVWRRRCRH